MVRGRPVKSEIRQNIIDIINYLDNEYGYNIYKVYINVFPKCTLEVVYYHLRKGVLLEELKVHKVKQEKGNFSWGPMVEKIYYSLGPNAKPRPNKRIKDAIELLNKQAKLNKEKKQTKQD